MTNKQFRMLKHTYFIFGILILLVFLAGILVGKGIKLEQENEISRFIKNSELSTESYILEQSLSSSSDETSCEIAKIRIDDLSNELYQIGKKIGDENSKSGLRVQEFEYLKLKYHLMQIRTYFLLSKLKENCDTQANIILYFYGTADPDSQKQGQVLDSIVNDFDVKVFAIEYNYSTKLGFLENFYNISKTPAIIVNNIEAKQGLSDYDEIKDLIDDKSESSLIDEELIANTVVVS